MTFDSFKHKMFTQILRSNYRHNLYASFSTFAWVFYENNED